ncbi:hypothetical protein C0Q70_05539 [Pomacea canaliculata]|uniref:G-protein coupled receptors family 1 profile domain-containing protein n=1 Tax=Pomacea canaliculata TaxID=400727 RepID=A0A2T7PLI3_POMCA|nr:uncharacterized protein LOC112559566 [Pomacea canaliculata]PVD34270.1 hypothetical protein C0Q70_05539 [Pomacea canaliculata]
MSSRFSTSGRGRLFRSKASVHGSVLSNANRNWTNKQRECVCDGANCCQHVTWDSVQGDLRGGHRMVFLSLHFSVYPHTCLQCLQRQDSQHQARNFVYYVIGLCVSDFLHAFFRIAYVILTQYCPESSLPARVMLYYVRNYVGISVQRAGVWLNALACCDRLLAVALPFKTRSKGQRKHSKQVQGLRAARGHHKNTDSTHQHPSDLDPKSSRSEAQITKMVLLLTSAFFCVESPVTLNAMLGSLLPHYGSYKQEMYLFRVVGELLMLILYLNQPVLLLLSACYSGQYRRTLRHVICACPERIAARDRTTKGRLDESTSAPSLSKMTSGE